jgi:CMP-N-acetylneuraminic acid synthetase
MHFLTIIPARKESKGIRNKNFVNFLGKKLIEHTLIFAKKIKNNTIIISSDSKNRKILSTKYKTISEYIRPKRISKDNTLLEDTLNHVIRWSVKKKIDFDYILLMQPTSPIRKMSDFKKMLKILKTKKIETLCSVTKVQHHPAEYVERKKKKWFYLINTKRGLRQTYNDNYYFIDGSFYIIEKKYFIKNKKILSKNNFFIPLSIKYPIDINNPIDLKIGTELYKKKNENN